LVGVCHANHKGFCFDDAFVHINLETLGVVANIFHESYLGIRPKAARFDLREAFGDISIEAHACNTNKYAPVDGARVYGFHMIAIDEQQSLAHIEGNLHETRQTVAGTRGNDAHGGVGVEQTLRHLVDGAIAAHGNDGSVAHLSRLTTQLNGMSLGLGVADFVIEGSLVQMGFDAAFDNLLLANARFGIDDEAYFAGRVTHWCR